MLDKELLKTINEMDSWTRQQLLLYDKDLQAALKAHSRGDSIVDTNGLAKKLSKAAVTFGGSFAAGLILYNALAAKRSLDKDNKRLLTIFGKAGANKKIAGAALNQSKNNEVARITQTFIKRKFPGTNVNVGQRIKTATEGSEKVIRNIISQGVANGKSSWDIGREISAYVVPTPKGLRVAPWTITRRELGKPVSYIPKGIPAGSVEYNAFRIARAETVETYHQAPYNANKDKWYYKGTKWHLSRSHPKTDRCDDYASHNEGIGKGVWRVLPRLPHPHCICWTETLVVDSDEMVDWLKKVNWL